MKNNQLFILTLLIFCPLFFCSQDDPLPYCTLNEYHQASCNLYRDCVHFIDRQTGGLHDNFLFRGNMPKNKSNQFAYNELKQYMAQEAKLHNINFPDQFYLVDLSLLVFVEDSDLKIEQDFFRNNPQLGKVMNYPMMGMCISPAGIPDSVRKPMALDLMNWTWDKLYNMVNLIKSQMSTSRNMSTVVYIHCEAGKDRTGEISGAYYLQQLKMFFNAAVKINYDSPPQRQISPDMLNGLQWFCYYLQYKFNFNLDCTLSKEMRYN